MADYTIAASTFSQFWEIATAELNATLTEMLFYGILLVLVAFALNLLVRRRAAGGPILLIATCLMFLLATVQFIARILASQKAFDVLYLAVEGQFASNSALARNAAAQNLALNFVEDVLLVTNNIVTDGMLIYRCFLIWERNYYAVAPPAILLFVSSILSYLAAYEGDYPTAAGPTVDLRFGFALSVLTNIVLVGLTAGRILFTRRKAQIAGMHRQVLERYNTATAMVLESGGILCAWVIAYVILRSISPPTVWRVFRGGMAQILNIVPTLIVVRVGLGHSMSGSDSTLKGSQRGEKTATSV